MSSDNKRVESIKNIVGSAMNKINTSVAGTIVSYNPNTNRAIVKPSGQVIFEDSRKLPYPEIHNVPLVFPASMGGTCGVTFPINSGDGCLIVFSQDNMDDFLSKSKSDDTRKFQLTDAIAIPGLYTASTDGQSNKSSSLCLFYSGSTVTLDSNGFIGTLADGTNFTFSGGDLVVNGISLTKHVHTGVTPGGGTTGKPQ